MQPKLNPAGQYLGPYLGLNDQLDPSRLGWRYAVEASNVMLSEQLIRPRAPMKFLASLPSPSEILSMYAWSPPRDDYRPQVLIKTAAGVLYAVNGDGALTTLTTQLVPGRVQADLVRFGEFVYVLDGSFEIWKTAGLAGQRHTLKVGLPRPVLAQPSDTPPTGDVKFTPIAASGVGPFQQFDYAVTFYDSTNNVESNPLYSDPVTIHVNGANGGMDITFPLFHGLPVNRNVTNFRIYRRNKSLGKVGWRLLGSAPAVPSNGWTDQSSDAQITASTDANGPFAPARNGIPRNATCGCLWQGRLMMNRLDKPGRITFSPINQPDYLHYESDADADALVAIGDGDDRIRGLAVQDDQLLIGKGHRARLWLCSGQLAGPTNLTTATGALPLESGERLYPTAHHVGPMNSYGNGFLAAAHSGSTYFAAEDGFYVFSAGTLHNLAMPIKKLWSTIVGPGMQGDEARSVTLADDRHNGVIYLMISPKVNVPNPPPTAKTLVYHYRLDGNRGEGGWTTLDHGNLSGTDLGSPAVVGVSNISCVVIPLRHKEPGSLQASDDRPPTPLWGFEAGWLARSVHYSSSGTVEPNDADDARIPYWIYRTGDVQRLRGKRDLMYLIKWFFSAGSNLGNQGCPVDFTVVCDPLTRDRRLRVTRDLILRRAVEQPVRQTCETVRLEIARNSDWLTGWDERIGVVGWQIDQEFSGRR